MSKLDQASYMGWANYPTWAVHLYISDDSVMHASWLVRADYALQLFASMSMRAQLSSARGMLAMELEAALGTDIPHIGHPMYAAILQHAVDAVDWYEIASALLTSALDAASDEGISNA